VHQNRIPRRTFLRGVGVTLALPLFEREVSAAQNDSTTDVVPTRLVCVANPLGFVPDAFFPEQGGVDYQPTELLEPLRKSTFTIFSNLDHGVSGGHQAVHSFLSGIRDNESAQFPSRNISVDQRAAEHVGAWTRYPSIVASVGTAKGEIACHASWTRNGVNVPPVTDERRLFESLFVARNPQERRQQRAALRRHASVLDAVREQAKVLKRDLGSSDRRKLEEYFGSVRAVEQQMEMAIGWIDRPKPKVDLEIPTGRQVFTKRTPLYFDLIALALQTDSTRVATLSIPGTLPVSDLGLSGSYHAFSHHGKDSSLRSGLLAIERFQMTQLARFIDRLDSIDQPDGRSLLDHTMVLSGSGMGNGSSHSNKNLPIVLAGGGYRHGSHLVMPDAHHQRVPLCNLYTTMLQRFGVEIDRFNTASGTVNGLELA
jgi:hypothetical protein